MSAPAYLPLFGSDYLADTAHLTTEEHGAYLLLLMAAWRQDDCGLPNDDRKLARIVGLSVRKWAGIKATILEFWTVEDGRIFQARLRKERGYADRKSEGNRQNASKRWAKQAVEKQQSEPCERICDGNAPQPQEEEKKERKEEGAGAPRRPSEEPSDDGRYAFCGRVIRLDQAGFQKWAKAFDQLDLPAMLQSRDDWYSSQPDDVRRKWFIPTSNWLASRQQEAKRLVLADAACSGFNGPC